jgi:two-component system sensor histidine kinase ArlS
MRNIKSKGLQERVVTTNAKDEISDLSMLFNDMMDDLETSFRQQKQFVEDASHELKTPLAILEGHLSLLNRWGKDDPEILNESLQVGLQEVGRLKGIVHELLDMTRAETVQFLTGEPVEVKSLVQNIIQSVSAIHADFHIQTDLESLSQVRIRIVPQHLEQIILILLDNAMKYSDERKDINVIGQVVHNKVAIQVIDYGIGIPKEDLPHVFDRFYRVDKSRTRERGGVGLGLSIAYRLVHAYDGEISINNGSHQGVCVTLLFPIVTNE